MNEPIGQARRDIAAGEEIIILVLGDVLDEVELTTAGYDIAVGPRLAEPND